MLILDAENFSFICFLKNDGASPKSVHVKDLLCCAVWRPSNVSPYINIGQTIYFSGLLRSLDSFSHSKIEPGVAHFITGHEQTQLNLKAPVTTAADDIHKYFFKIFFRENKT